MNNEVIISNKFKPLFQLLDKNYHSEIDTVIMTGGRYSLKSFTVSIFALTALYNFGWNVLYTRFTNMSITDSIKPEVSDKIELLNLTGVNDTQHQIEYNGNRIAFKGIKTGSSQQTANLKSLSGFNLFINDEAEELPDYKTYKKIFYSIRSTDKRNISILILNPTVKDHWIFQEYFEKKGLEGGNNCIVDNVLYIHTSYLDCDFNLMPKNILSDYLRLKSENKKEYDNIVLGGWIDQPEGILIPFNQLKWIDKKLITDQHIVYRFSVIDPANTGGDKFSQPFIYVIFTETMFAAYIADVLHNTDGIEVNCERIPQKAIDHKIENLPVESNGLGLAAVILLKKILPQFCKLMPFTSSVNKDARVLSNFEFILRYFYFDKEKYETNKEYNQFVKDLTSFTKEGDNKHKKDAIDVCASAAHILKIKYHNILFSK